MAYNYLLLKTTNDCDAVLQILQDQSVNMQMKKLQLLKKSSASGKLALQIEVGISAVEGEIGIYDERLLTATGADISILQNKKKIAEGKLASLLTKRDNAGVFAIFEGEYNNSVNELAMASYNDLVAGIEARKVELTTIS